LPLSISSAPDRPYPNGPKNDARHNPVLEGLRFLCLAMRKPARLGAVVPSGRSLAAAIADEIDAGVPGPVVELGGGTGNITSALLDNGVDPGEVVVIEREPALSDVISSRFPNIRVICGDAGDAKSLLAAAGILRVKAVVSGLPLLSMSDQCRRNIVAQSFGVMREEGVFVQFTYGPSAPMPRPLSEELGLIGKRSTWVLENLPPASVWSYRRRLIPSTVCDPVELAAGC
jgi:phosphatidylethanolamine/phosphatidyl-N-methylethanolamine N-methyltransferase